MANLSSITVWSLTLQKPSLAYNLRCVYVQGHQSSLTQGSGHAQHSTEPERVAQLKWCVRAWL